MDGMNKSLRLPLFALLLPLTGCVNIPQMAGQPARQDPFAGIDIEKRSPAFPHLNLALLLSENTRNSVAFGRQGGAMGGFDIAPIIEKKFELFKANFKSAFRIDKLADAKASSADLVALYDSFADVSGGFKLDTTVVFMDVDGKELERIQARGERRVPLMRRQSMGGPIQEVVKEVNLVLDKAMRDSAKLADFARSRGKSPVAAAPSAPASAAPAPALAPIRPVYKSGEKTDHFAMVVGIENYSSLPSARFAERDAADMAEHFGALGVPRRNIVHLAGSQATLTGLKKYLQAWLPKNVTPSSRVYFYFSGHGAPDAASGNAYLVPWDGDPSYLAESAYPLSQLYSDLGRLPAASVLVALDACFSGAGGRSVLAKGARPLVAKVDMGQVPGDKMTLLAAASGNEITSAVDAEGHGMFTYFLLKGLNGAAKDSSGRVTVKGLYDYLKPHVQDEARRQNREQTPTLQAARDTILRGE